MLEPRAGKTVRRLPAAMAAAEVVFRKSRRECGIRCLWAPELWRHDDRAPRGSARRCVAIGIRAGHGKHSDPPHSDAEEGGNVTTRAVHGARTHIRGIIESDV